MGAGLSGQSPLATATIPGLVQLAGGLGVSAAAIAGGVAASTVDVSFGTSPATSGRIRCATTDTAIAFRNNANTGDIAAVSKTAADLVLVNGGAGGVALQVSGVTALSTNGTTITAAIPFQAVGTSAVAAAGAIRLANAAAVGNAIAFRNVSNTADVALAVDNNNLISLGLPGSAAGGLVLHTTTSSSHLKFDGTNGFQWGEFLTTGVMLQHARRGSDNPTTDFLVLAQGAAAAAVANLQGASVVLRGGAAATTNGIRGGVRLQLNGTTDTMCEVGEVTTGGHRFVALCRGANLTATDFPSTAGDRVAWVGDAATLPTGNAASGHLYFSDAGRPTWRTSAGAWIRLDLTTAATATGGAAVVPALASEFLMVQTDNGARKIACYLT